MKPLIRRLLCCLCTPHALLSWSWHQCFARAGAHFNSRSQTLWCSRHTYWNPVGVVERATVSSAVCSDVMARNQPVSCSLRTVWATRMLKMPSARPHPPRYHLSHRPVAVAQELPRLAILWVTTAYASQRNHRSVFERSRAPGKATHLSALIARSLTAHRARYLSRNGCFPGPRNLLRECHFRIVCGVYYASDLKTAHNCSARVRGVLKRAAHAVQLASARAVTSAALLAVRAPRSERFRGTTVHGPRMSRNESLVR